MSENVGYSDPQGAPIVYLAAPWKDRDRAKEIRTQLQEAGIVINSRWLDFVGSEELAKDEQKRQEALNDIEDVLNADTVVVLNSIYSEGKAAETGMAIILMKGIVLIGEPSNVFHYLDFPKVKTVEEAIPIVLNYPWKMTQLRLSREAVAEVKPLVTES